MTKKVKIGNSWIGDGHPAFLIAEIGINHNGDMSIAKSLIDIAASAGFNAVKFQKRTPELCVPPDQRGKMRETPWGYISYMEYRERVEFGKENYQEIDNYCRERSIQWMSSCWDEPSVDFMEQFDPPAYKVPSAMVTKMPLLRALKKTGRPIILSTGMSTMEQIRAAVKELDSEHLVITHCTSTYPCPLDQLNLTMIGTLKREFDCPVGYSGHEVGLPPSIAAVAMGASCIERHVTLDRSMWGSDHAASIEPHGQFKLVKYIRGVEQAMGNGIKQVYESEMPILKKLRGEERVS